MARHFVEVARPIANHSQKQARTGNKVRPEWIDNSTLGPKRPFQQFVSTMHTDERTRPSYRNARRHVKKDSAHGRNKTDGEMTGGEGGRVDSTKNPKGKKE